MKQQLEQENKQENTVNDPNSPDNSAKHWTYDRLSPQISNLWFLEALKNR